jgi:hypothetical protein
VANGVTVNFLSNKEMNDKYNKTASGHVGALDFRRSKVTMSVDIRMSLRGNALRGTVAHEGDHVGRISSLAQSYNPATGLYSASLNYTVRQMEVHGWELHNRITNQFKSHANIEQFVEQNYLNLNNHIIVPEATE